MEVITLIIKRVVGVTLGFTALIFSVAGAAPSIPESVSAHPNSPYSLLNQFLFDSEPFGQLATNIQSKVQSCMGHDGWKYWSPTHIAFNSEYTDLKNFWTFRNTEGFGASSQVIYQAKHRLVPPVANFQYLTTLTSAQRSTYWIDLTGSPTSVGNYALVPLTIPPVASKGCEAGARRKVLSRLPYFQIKSRATIEDLYTELSGAKIVAAGTRNWEACMARSGFAVHYFDQEEAKYLQESSKLTLRAAERNLPAERSAAVVDARCFLNYLYAEETAYSRTILRAFAKKFPKYNDSISRLLRDEK